MEGGMKEEETSYTQDKAALTALQKAIDKIEVTHTMYARACAHIHTHTHTRTRCICLHAGVYEEIELQ